MELTIGIITGALSALTAFAFYKAGSMKVRASKAELDTLAPAMEKLPESAGKLIGALELLGSLGLVAGVTGYFLGFPWAIWFAIAAAVGLAVTMIGAISVHAVRRETKASIKMTAPLLLASTLSAVGWVLFISL